MPDTVYCIQHKRYEGPGLIRHWARERGHTLRYVHVSEGGRLPETTPDTPLILMGGPMGVEDRRQLDWMDAEIEWLGRHIASGGRAFGVCLGAQVIAAAMGAEVRRNADREIGWMPVRFLPSIRGTVFDGAPEELTVMHWHGDTFAIPAGGTVCASSDACVNQAFCVGSRVIALQFHLEAEPELLVGFLNGAEEDLRAGGPYVQAATTIADGVGHYMPACRQLLYTLLDRWLDVDSTTVQAVAGSDAA